MSRFDYSALREPTFYAHGEELPRLLEFSERLLADGEGYEGSYGDAVAGLTQLIAVAGEQRGDPAPIDRAVVVASDLHSNGLVLPALEEFASGRPVFMVGDLTQRGTEYESAIVPGARAPGLAGRRGLREPRLAAAHAGGGPRRGDRAHAERPAAGGRLHGRRPGGDGRRPGGRGLRGSARERQSGTFEGRLLELKENSFIDARRQFLEWFETLPERPDVVLVHRHGLAHALLDLLATQGGPPVLILTGHDHDQHVDTEGAHVLVDGGSVGAGGAFGVGEEPRASRSCTSTRTSRRAPSTSSRWSRPPAPRARTGSSFRSPSRPTRPVGCGPRSQPTGKPALEWSGALITLHAWRF